MFVFLSFLTATTIDCENKVKEIITKVEKDYQ